MNRDNLISSEKNNGTLESPGKNMFNLCTYFFFEEMRLHLFQKEWYNIYIKRLDSVYISMKIIKNYIENFDKYSSKE